MSEVPLYIGASYVPVVVKPLEVLLLVLLLLKVVRGILNVARVVGLLKAARLLLEGVGLLKVARVVVGLRGKVAVLRRHRGGVLLVLVLRSIAGAVLAPPHIAGTGVFATPDQLALPGVREVVDHCTSLAEGISRSRRAAPDQVCHLVACQSSSLHQLALPEVVHHCCLSPLVRHGARRAGLRV